MSGALSGPAVAALAGGGGLVLAGLYLLRRRRIRMVVPFLPLWAPGTGDRPARRVARRLRRWLSLVLQLWIFGLLMTAAADPRRAPESVAGHGNAGGRTVVILVDRSASMAALDEPGSRLARAQDLARGIVDGLGPDDRALVASFAADVTAATGMERDPTRLKAAVNALRPSDEPGDLNAALAFSAALLRGHPRPTLVLVSDGSMPGAATNHVVEALRGIDVRLAPVGRRRDNLAIVAFSARRMPADPSSVELTVVLQSFRSAAADIDLTITAGPARVPVARRSVHLAPGARAPMTLSNVPIPDPRLQASLENVHDDLPADDHAFAVVPAAAALRVMVIGAKNLYLDAALLSLGGAVAIQRVAPGAVESSRDRWATMDVVIFDGVVPNPAPRTGHFLFIDPHGPASPWPDHGTISDPVVTDVLRDHPIGKQLNLTDLNVATARSLTLERDDVPVVSALRVPLLVARANQNLRLVALAFDVRKSDLPLRGAFPLLLSNTLTWLAIRPATEALSFATGRTVRLDIGDGASAGASAGASRHPAARAGSFREVSVVGPDGAVARAPVIAGGVTLYLDRIGITEVRAPDGTAIGRVAANLASTEESDIGPHPALRIGERKPDPPDAPRPGPRHDLWVLALLAALICDAGEWLFFHRHLTV